MGAFTGDKNSVLFQSLSGFWQRFFADTADLEAFYQASETYLGQVYLDLMSSVLGTGLVDTPVFNKEQWKLFAIDETQVNYLKGLTTAEDRYVYDPPSTIVNLQTLQNTIFDPQVVLDNGVDFEVEDNDGIVRFHEDPFQATLNSNGQYMPENGIAWRTITKTVGHRFYDKRMLSTATSWDWIDKGVKRGDTLRFLARAEETPHAYGEAVSNPGFFGSVGLTPVYYFQNPSGGLGNVVAGDILEITGCIIPGFEDHYGCYIVKTPVSATRVDLDLQYLPVTIPSWSAPPLSWRIYHSTSLPLPFDSEVDYIRGRYVVGPEGNPYPLDTLMAPWVYAVVRDVPDGTVTGFILTGWSSIDPLPAPVLLTLPHRHIVRGSVKVSARVTVGADDEAAREDRDYAVDYVNGYIYQLKPWLDYSAGRVNYSYQQEVLRSVGGKIERYTSANDIVQLSLWAPEVLVDRYTLANNFGVFINRFQASSETYKEYLRGIISLYVNGPVFKRMESALNVIGNYAVIWNDGEILQSYDSGVTAQGTDAVITALSSSVAVSVADHVFSTDDLGAFIVLSGDTPGANQGKFPIVAIDTVNNAAVISTIYALVDDSTDVDWVLTRSDQQTVTTNKKTYTYSFETPLRTDVKDAGNYGTLTFEAFEALTSVFRVVDYIEDPTWWHGVVIPKELWSENSRTRRTAYTRLVENIIDPEDDARIDDPGLYLDASETGVVLAGGVPAYRHSAAYLLFDKYLKAHTFNVQIAADVPLIPAFQQDLQELILISKPGHTYPFVGTSDLYVDTLGLIDELAVNIAFSLGGSGDGYPDMIRANTNALLIDDPCPFVLDDMFNYPGWNTYDGTALSGYSTQPVDSSTVVTAGETIVLVPETNGAITSIHIPATRASDGKEVLEGRDYTVDWRADEPTAWTITILEDWTPLAADLVILFRQVLHVGAGTFDAHEEGWSPILVDGTNPWYIRAGALNPNEATYAQEMAALRVEHVDCPLWIRVDEGLPS
jgi:hypothetical protein